MLIADSTLNTTLYLLQESIHGSINHLRVIIFNDTGSTYQKVEKYTLKLKEFLSSCLFHLNDTLRDVIRIPQIVASQSATEIQEVLFKYKSNSGENVEDTFKAYDTIRDFIKVCKVASPDSASKICLRDNFFEGVISWLDTAEMEMEKWVINAIKVDNFQIIATNTYHSTSVIDMFSCFSGYVNFIKNLDWNNKEDEQLFNERLYGNMLKCLKMYTAKMIFLIKEELDSPKSDAPLKTLREVEKSTGPYTSVINHESNVIDHRVSGNKKYTLNSGDMKVTSLICAYLSNINAINSKIETLFGANKALIKFDPKTSGSRRLSEIPIPKTLSLRAQRQIKNSFIPVKVHIDKLESTVVKFPHLMPVSVRLSYNGSIIMSTKPLVQQPCTEYNESAWINLSDSIDSDTTTFNPAKGKSIYSKLEISIVKIICENGSIDTNEDIMASTLIDIDWFTDDEKIMLISIPECGKLTIKLSPISYNLRLAIFPTIVNWLVETSTNEAQTIIAQKIASVYRSHVKTISHKFKSISKDYINKMFNSIEMLEKNKKSFANSINSIIPQQQIDQEIVSQEIGPVLSVLNANLERIVSECPLTPAIKLISKIWDYIMLANESLLVPLDIESRKEKSAWSQDRVKFLEITIQILYVFFECDGEGLSKEELDTPRYKHVQKIIKDYFEPRKVLYSKKKDMFGGTSDSISEGSCSPWMPNYWIFQILKVHSDTENVYSYVREVSDLFKQIRCDLSEDITSIGSNLEPEKVK